MSGRLARRVAEVAEELLGRKGVVTPLDVLNGLGWLSSRVVRSWELGTVPVLDATAAVPAERVAEAVASLHEWAGGRGLTVAEAEFVAATRDRRPLRFTAGGDERRFHVRWVDPGLSGAKLARATAPKAPELMVLIAERGWHCGLCGEPGAADGCHFVEDGKPVCLDCADFGHLVFLPSGDAALTRRARKATGLAAVVARWNRSRKRFDRRGLLVERAALEEAERSCLADEDARERRRERDRARRAAEDVDFQAAFALRIAELFPALDRSRAHAIAEHAGTRGSGRVGRSAQGRALDEHAVTLAVVAAIRHEETDYDAMLMAGVPRAEARERIRDEIDRVLARWRAREPA
ncbi:DUF2293 domain-containing protein [Actinokineospora sp. G85]|uniref:DUF2293 domain-containing protein n=1 Tax=Actinokineospora sp. G85 TaxID=3406626 RepID=UPI003C749FC2